MKRFLATVSISILTAPAVLFVIALILLLTGGCAYRDYQAPDGTRLRSAVLLWKSKVEHVQVSTNGLKIIGAANAVDANAVESLSKGTAKGLTGQ